MKFSQIFNMPLFRTLALIGLYGSYGSGAVLAQQRYTSPIDFTISLSGNVGEIRSGHFHTGLDFNGLRGIGSKIMAVADGYVSRIGVSGSGYGNVLYVTHPDGRVSVYAHMDGFVSDIQNWVRTMQYAKKSFVVDLYPTAGQFPVRQGQQIGMLGNTGSSGGAHLHLEIRQAGTGSALNLISQGYFRVSDHEKPNVRKVHLFEIDTIEGVLVFTHKKSIDPQSDDLTLSLSKNGYLAYETIDYRDGRTNTMGVYALEQRINGTANFSFKIDEIPWTSGRYVNSLTEYDLSRRTPKFDVLRAYVSENNGLKIYKTVLDRGVIKPQDADIETTITDDMGNTTTFKFRIQAEGRPAPAPVISPDAKVVMWNRAFKHTFSDGAEVTLPAGSLYDNTFIGFSADPSSTVYTIGSSSIPLHKAMTLNLSVKAIPLSLRAKALIARVSEGKITGSISGKIEQGRIIASTNQTGSYTIALDTIAPQIKASARDKNGILKFKITDNLAGIWSYTLTIDGTWELAQYDAKTATLTHKTTASGTPISHVVQLVVTDARGNRKTYKQNIVW